MTSILQSQSSPAGSICKKGVCWPQRFDVDRAFSCLQRTNSSVSVSSEVVQRVGCHACSFNRGSQLPRSGLTHQFAKWHFAVECVWQIFSILTCLCLLLKNWLNLVHILQYHTNIILRYILKVTIYCCVSTINNEWVVWTTSDLGRSWRANFIFDRLF